MDNEQEEPSQDPFNPTNEAAMMLTNIMQRR